MHRYENFNLTAQYVWPYRYGNNEGGVNSDNLQTDTGVSSFLDLAASAKGNLPNGRRYAFKFYGSYNLTEYLAVGWNYSLIDGRTLTIRGQRYPTDGEFQQPGYGDTYYTFNSITQQFVFNPRVANGRSLWVFTSDASLS